MPQRNDTQEANRAGNTGGRNSRPAQPTEAELFDLGSEREVVACMLINPSKVIPMVAAILDKSDFTDSQLGQTFDCLVKLHHARVNIFDVTIAVRELKAMGVSNASSIVKSSQAYPNESGAVYHAGNVRNLARLRGILKTVGEIRQEVYTPKVAADDVIGLLDGRLRQLRTGAGSVARQFHEIAADVIADFRRRVDNPEPAVLLSGLPAADRCGFVFGDGELIVLAARPGVGKTSLATQIAMHHAGKGRCVLIASLEMRDRDLISRVIMASSGLNHQAVRTGTVVGSEVDDMEAAAKQIGKPPLFVLSPGRVKAGFIHASAAVLKASHGLRLLIVDYIGLVKPDDYSRQRYEQVGEIAKALRDIGQHLQIPVICLAQLNREADSAEPKLSNLRESGDIEQDADVVAFLHVPEPRNRTNVELIVAKDRQGAAGRTSLVWHPEQTRFEDTSIGQRWAPLPRSEQSHLDIEEFT